MMSFLDPTSHDTIARASRRGDDVVPYFWPQAERDRGNLGRRCDRLQRFADATELGWPGAGDRIHSGLSDRRRNQWRARHHRQHQSNDQTNGTYSLTVPAGDQHISVDGESVADVAMKDRTYRGDFYVQLTGCVARYGT